MRGSGHPGRASQGKPSRKRGDKLSGTGGSAAGTATGAVMVVHGGRSVSTDPTTVLQLSVLRMIPMARAVRQAVRGSGIVVSRPRFQVRGWNGPLASPVPDLIAVLDRVGDSLGPVPVLLIGHSMGARAALRVAGHPQVSAVTGLAPWLPRGEPVQQLAGRQVMLAHGSADSVTSAADTWAYAERARSVAPVATVEVRDGDHAMLRRAVLWHRIAGASARLAFRLPVTDETMRDALQRAGAQAHRTVL